MPKVRVSISRNSGKNRNKFSAVLVEPTYDDLLKKAKNKLKLKKKELKNARFFIYKDNGLCPAGTQLPHSQSLEHFICNDTILTVSVSEKEDFIDQRGNKRQKAKADSSLPKPPRWPHPGGSISNVEKPKPAFKNKSVELPDRSALDLKLAKTSNDRMLQNAFPIFSLDENLLPMIRDCIADSPGFVEKNFGEYISFDYSTSGKISDLFPNPLKGPKKDRFASGVKRECRGLILCARTGRIIARRFQKFFNIDEIEEETNAELIACRSNDFEVTNKIDGSLVSPFILPGSDDVLWALKSTVSPSAQAYSNENPAYSMLARHCISQNMTPLFEWCESKKPVGVIEYEESSLTLLAVRSMEDGSYLSYKDLLKLSKEFDVPLVQSVEISGEDFKEFINNVRSLSNVEGVVLSFSDGFKVKLKSFWYVKLAEASKACGKKNTDFLLETLNSGVPLQDVPDPVIWKAMFQDQADDIISACTSILNDSILEEFHSRVKNAVDKLAGEFLAWGHRLQESPDEAKQVVEDVGWHPNLGISVLAQDKLRCNDAICLTIKELLKKREISAVEMVLGPSWDRMKMQASHSVYIIDDPSFGSLTECPPDIIEHVLETYLPKKMSRYVGGPMSDDTLIQVDLESNGRYRSSEGRIDGYWEKWEKDRIVDLRIDLQPCQLSGRNAHYGDGEYALWMIQYGDFRDKSRGLIGDYAAVYLQVGVSVRYADFKAAISRSFQTQGFVKITTEAPKDTSSDLTIYCDLDGVLADFDKEFYRIAKKFPNDVKAGARWKIIREHPSFFSNLEFSDDGKKLWNFFKEMNINPTILTAVPSNAQRKQYSKQKVSWCEKHLGIPAGQVICCDARQKPRHSGKNQILIDDFITRKAPWEARGGKFIHHTSSQHTINSLMKLMGGLTLPQELNQALLSLFDSQLELQSYSLKEDQITFVESTKDALPILERCMSSKVVGIDCEWRPSELQVSGESAACLLQLATDSSQAFVFDLLKIPSSLFQPLFQSESVLKIGFGLTEDANHLESAIVNSLDLKDIFESVSGKVLSLGDLVKKCLGFAMVKSKELQYSDWMVRPLKQSQIRYAGADATILLELANILPLDDLCQFSAVVRPTRKLRTSTKAAITKETLLTGEVRALWTAIFLDEKSKDLLAMHFPPRFPHHYADHITLAIRPSGERMHLLPAGKYVQIEVIGQTEDRNNRVQALSVRFKDENLAKEWCDVSQPHVTISCAENVQPKEAHEARYKAFSLGTKTFVLGGVVGVEVATMDATILPGVPKRIFKKVLDLLENGQPGEKLKFKSNELNSQERSTLHAFCEKRGLISKSTGKKAKREGDVDMRKLVISKPKFQKKEITSGEWLKTERSNNKKGKSRDTQHTQENTVHRILDEQNLQAVEFIVDADQQQYDGFVTSDGVEWKSFSENCKPLANLLSEDYNEEIGPNVVVILRGLPGSGKSRIVCELTRGRDHAVICSADSYFERAPWKKRSEKKGMTPNEIYASSFDLTKLNDAHDYCRKVFDEAIEEQRSIVIIDNTNIRRSNYVYYKREAAEAGYDVIVVSLKCVDFEMVKMCARRCVHNVSLNAISKSRRAWEDDDQAIKLRPYVPQQVRNVSLNHWLREIRAVHYDKGRRCSHLQMEVGEESVFFLDVPLRHEIQFLEYFALDPEDKFLTEFITQPTFRAFLDVDYCSDEALSKVDMVPLAKTFQNVLVKVFSLSEMPEIICIGASQPTASPLGASGALKTGFHLHADVAVTKTQMLQVVNILIDQLTGNWKDALDVDVYTHGGLRLLGSLKTKKGKIVDDGRPYDLLFVVDKSGKISSTLFDLYAMNRVALLQKCSVRVLTTESTKPPQL